MQTRVRKIGPDDTIFNTPAQRMARGELEHFRHLITQVYPSGVVSTVSDTWDFWKVITDFASALKSDILARTPNALGLAKVVFRPDSGDPVEILCGSAQIDTLIAPDLAAAGAMAQDIMRNAIANSTPHGEYGLDTATGLFRFKGVVYKAEIEIDWNRHDKQFYFIDGVSLKSFEPHALTPAEKGAVECLWDIFGGTATGLGYRTLHERVGLIYGDSITLERMEEILKRLAAKNFSAGNVVFGVGSYTYQYVTRDTFGMAMKATWGVVNGEPRDLFKDPITDPGKKSAKGLLRVEKEGNDFVLYDQQTSEQEQQGALEPVFQDGNLLRFESLAPIRARLVEDRVACAIARMS